MQISHDSLVLLDAIDRRGSFAKAAEELDRATSAVSYGVQRLEEQLGITVYERQGRRSVLTPAGRLLLEEGRKILAATSRLADRAQELANGWETRVRIALEATLDPTFFFDALSAFQNDHPSIEIDISESLLNASWEALEHGHVDLLVGAVAPIPAHKGFRTEQIGTARLVPVIGSSHPDIKAILATGDHSGAVRIANHDPVTSEVARSEGFNLTGRRTLFVQTMGQKLQAIEAGLGVGHLPQHLIDGSLASGKIVQLADAPNEPEQFLAFALSNKGKGLQALAQRLTGQ